jgi:hypothetical protein
VAPSRLSSFQRPVAIAAWVAVVLLCVSRMLVVCEGPHCDRAIEFMHASGACCEAAHGALPENDHCACADHGGEGSDDGLPEASHRGCVDTAFVLEIAPPPTKVCGGADHTAPVAILPWTAPALACPRTPVVVPHATGPPRRDDRTHRRRSTVLLI